MMLTRRGLLGAAALGAAAVGLTACGAGNGGGTTADGKAALRLGWWGNPTRNQNTTDVIAAYQTANPNVTITPEPGDWASYWQKLATQTAANDAPDVIQMDMAYIREYGERGALLDLSKHGVETADFAPGTADAGRTSKGLMGINAGVNTPVLLANPKLFTQAGVDFPDDETWTWPDLQELATKLTEGSKGAFSGLSASIAGDVSLQFWLRQSGKSLYNEKGLAFDTADVVPYLTWVKSLYDSKASPSAAATVEDASKALDQQMFATGKVAMCLYWSNQVKALDKASGQDLKLLRLPTASGKFAESHYWYKASMLWSASSRTKNPAAAGALINFLVNNEAAVKIIKAERGMPPNLKMRALISGDLDASDKKSAAFLDAVTPGIKEAPIPPLVGSSAALDALSRLTTDMAFGRTTPEAAAKGFVDEAKSSIKV